MAALGLAAACSAAVSAWGQGLARDLRESVQHTLVAVHDLDGHSATTRIPITLYRPTGDGPFALAVVSHGRDAPDKRREMGRARFEMLARYLVARGFAVAVPTRVGYGETYGSFDPERVGSCKSMQLDALADATAEQVLAAVEHARTLPWIDATRWIAVGQSVGGVATLAAAARSPLGLAGAINFSGGVGGNPERRPADPCSPQQLEQLWRQRGGLATAPTLWLYWENDLYWGAEHPRRWAAAWAAGGGEVRLHQLSAASRDGHAGLLRDMDHWTPIVDAWLAARGFKLPPSTRPAPSGFARVDDVDKVPTSALRRESLYRSFLAAQHPRAFAVGPRGAVGWASGDWASGRALAFCQRDQGDPCRLYAVDDDVVWMTGADAAR